MSGPKKADVEAALNVVRGTQRKCSSLISKAEDAAIAMVIQEAESTLKETTRAGASLKRAAGDLTAEMIRVAPDAVRGANDAARRAERCCEEADSAVSAAKDRVAQASRSERVAREIFSRAEAEYDRVATAVRLAGSHYLHQEMQQAKEAQRLFDQAATELEAAARARREAEKGAATALQRARDALAAVTAADQQAKGARKEGESRLRAEEETRRIAEQRLREATLAVERARSSFSRLLELPHQKFRPGEDGRLRKALEAAVLALQNSSFDMALSGANRVQADATRLAAEVAEAARKYERERTEAETHIGVLNAAIQGVDPDLIQDWAEDAGAIDEARRTLELARESLRLEQFEDVGSRTDNARAALGNAMRTAAEAKSAHERREITGAAIMEALQELGFDVTFEAGTRTEPLRILGQSSDETGRGDFDIAIPLSGEVDFEVVADQGDISCLASVQGLHDRLEARGIVWNTTDWGHAEGAAPTIRRETVTVTEGVKVRSKGKA